MNYRKIIDIMFDTLEKQFEGLYSEEEKYNLINSPLNKFYEGRINKYQYLLEKYICNNAIFFLNSYYENNKVSYDTRLKIIKWLYKSEYKFKMYYDDFSIVPKEFDDLNLLNEIIIKKDDALVANILYVSEKRNELYNDISSEVYYNCLPCYNLNNILCNYCCYENIDINIYDMIFNDLCEKDKYGYYIQSFLFEDCKFISSVNLQSIIRNLNQYNGELVNVDIRERKAKIFYSLLVNEKLNLIKSKNFEELLSEIKYFDENNNFTVKKLNK